MAKKLFICNGKSCRREGSYKDIKLWAEELNLKNKLKKSKCMGKCKETHAIKIKGHLYTCSSKSELEKVIENKK